MTKESARTCRFMAVAPLGRDGELICAFLKNSGFSCEAIKSVAEVEQEQSSLLFGLILTDEGLTGEGIEALRRIVEAAEVGLEHVLKGMEVHRLITL